MPQDLMGKALAARRAVMDLCQAVEANGRHGGPQAASADDRIAVRDQLIADLMRALGRLLGSIDASEADTDGTALGDFVAEARHTLDNVRNALPKAGE